MTGTMGTTWGGDHGEQVMGTTWGPSGDYGHDANDMGMMGMTRGPWGPHGDNKITKNAITFERIEIIEYMFEDLGPLNPPTHM